VPGFALRRVDRPEDAGDVTAETFLVAWRRLAHAPQEPESPIVEAVAGTRIPRRAA
jgi:DNA-directed RNA polymerase specialized sigma24 family protein